MYSLAKQFLLHVYEKNYYIFHFYQIASNRGSYITFKSCHIQVSDMCYSILPLQKYFSPYYPTYLTNHHTPLVCIYPVQEEEPKVHCLPSPDVSFPNSWFKQEHIVSSLALFTVRVTVVDEIVSLCNCGPGSIGKCPCFTSLSQSMCNLKYISHLYCQNY